MNKESNLVEKKLFLATQLFELAFRIKKQQLHLKHPELSDLEIQRKIIILFHKIDINDKSI